MKGGSAHKQFKKARKTIPKNRACYLLCNAPKISNKTEIFLWEGCLSGGGGMAKGRSDSWDETMLEQRGGSSDIFPQTTKFVCQWIKLEKILTQILPFCLWGSSIGISKF